MSSALTRTCCGYSAIASTQRISLSNSAPAADPGHHHRREQPAAPGESSCSRLSFLDRQQTCRQDCATKAFEGQSKEIEPRRCRVDQPRSPLTADVSQAGGLHLTDHAAPIVALESGLSHEAHDYIANLSEPRALALESVAGPVVVLDHDPPTRTQRGDQSVEDLTAVGEVLEHEPSVDQIEFVLRQLVFAEVDAADFDRIGGQRVDEAGVDVDRGDVGPAVRHPPHHRPTACADLETAPAASNSEVLEQRL